MFSDVEKAKLKQTSPLSDVRTNNGKAKAKSSKSFMSNIASLCDRPGMGWLAITKIGDVSRGRQLIRFLEFIHFTSLDSPQHAWRLIPHCVTRAYTTRKDRKIGPALPKRKIWPENVLNWAQNRFHTNCYGIKVNCVSAVTMMNVNVVKDKTTSTCLDIYTSCPS